MIAVNLSGYHLHIYLTEYLDETANMQGRELAIQHVADEVKITKRLSIKKLKSKLYDFLIDTSYMINEKGEFGGTAMAMMAPGGPYLISIV